jgi:SAM-dependent methyltransferase
VRDYCESVDELPHIAPTDGDLKNVQRPWAVKTVVGCAPAPARLLEIGGGEPIVSGFLAELGYDVTLADPYDGFGNGPTEYQNYVHLFPHVKILREYFRPGIPEFATQSFDCIFSVSVLEHIPADSLSVCFDAVIALLKPGGASIHCFDFILQGPGELDNLPMAERILAEQARVTGDPSPESLSTVLSRMNTDVETFYLSPQGHHHWRGGRAYDEFPFRKVVSLQTIARRPV